MATTSRPRPRRKTNSPSPSRRAQPVGCSGSRCTEPAVQHVVHVARKGQDAVDLWLCESHVERFRQGLYERSSPLATWLRRARGRLAS